MRLATILLIASAATLAQQAEKRAFGAASIKLNNSGGRTSTENVAPGRFAATNATVAELIQFAFGMRDFQVSAGRAGFATIAI